MKVGLNNTVEIDPDAAAAALNVSREHVAAAVRAHMEALIQDMATKTPWIIAVIPDGRT